MPNSSNRTLATSYPPVGVVKRALFRSGMSALRIPSLQEVDGSNKGNGNDEVGSGIGNSGGVPIGGVLDSGAKINVDGVADLIRTIDALVQGSIIGGGGGSGVNIGNGIRNGGNGYDVGEISKTVPPLFVHLIRQLFESLWRKTSHAQLVDKKLISNSAYSFGEEIR
nr:hypothetical protein [Tanacetum cinerariifolium]